MNDRLRERITSTFGLNTISLADLGRAVEHLGQRYGVAADQLDVWLGQSPENERDLAGRLTVGESYFLRHPDQLRVLACEVTDLVRQGRPVVVWSAGCSRGEEPFSVAIELLETAGPSIRQHVSILASDIDREAVETARRGMYSAWSLRSVPDALRRRYFEHTSLGLALRSDVRDWVKVDHLSVQEQLAELPDRSVDFVLFRNVAIYLCTDAVREIHAGFLRVLRRDGALLQAATDPCPDKPMVQDEAVPGVFRLPPRPRDPSLPPPPPARRSEPSPVLLIERAKATRRLGRWLRTTSSKDAVTERLANVSRELFEHPRDRDAHLVRAQISLHAGDVDSAIVDLRSALYLAPDHCLARYWYGVALGTGGQRARALQQLRHLRGRLDRLGPADKLEDGTTTVDDLREASCELAELLS